MPLPSAWVFQPWKVYPSLVKPFAAKMCIRDSAQAEARRGSRGGGGRMDAAHHALANLVDGLEHELAVLGGGEHRCV